MRCLTSVISLGFLLGVALQSFGTSIAPQRQARMTNGEPIPIAAAPYEASIRLKGLESVEGYGQGALCSGSVISQRMILTAASCTANLPPASQTNMNASEFTVVLGSSLIYRRTSSSLQYDVQEIVTHPRYDGFSPNFDIGALFIDGYIPWSAANVRAIQLNTKAVAPGTMCTVIGWGLSKNTTELMSLSVAMMSNSACPASYGENTTQTLLCAGNEMLSGVNACTLDVGSSLQCGGLLTGVVTNQNSCNEVQKPENYVNVSAVYGWIVSTNSSFNYSHYNGGGWGIYGKSNSLAYTTLMLTFVVGIISKFLENN